MSLWRATVVFFPPAVNAPISSTTVLPDKMCTHREYYHLIIKIFQTLVAVYHTIIHLYGLGYGYSRVCSEFPYMGTVIKSAYNTALSKLAIC